MSFRVYAADIEPLFEPELFSLVYGRVSPERREKTDRMRFQRDKCLSLGAEYLFLCSCADFGLDYASLRLKKGENSKPEIEGSSLQFNLSHSGKRAMCIMGEGSCGCDVEQLRPVKLEIAERYFAKSEYEYLISLPAEYREKAFYRLWTLKESFLKCTGEGLSGGLSSFSLSQDKLSLERPAGRGDFGFFEFDFNDGYAYSCCVEKADDERISGNEVRWERIEPCGRAFSQ